MITYVRKRDDRKKENERGGERESHKQAVANGRKIFSPLIIAEFTFNTARY